MIEYINQCLALCLLQSRAKSCLLDAFFQYRTDITKWVLTCNKSKLHANIISLSNSVKLPWTFSHQKYSPMKVKWLAKNDTILCVKVGVACSQYIFRWLAWGYCVDICCALAVTCWSAYEYSSINRRCCWRMTIYSYRKKMTTLINLAAVQIYSILVRDNRLNITTCFLRHSCTGIRYHLERQTICV